MACARTWEQPLRGNASVTDWQNSFHFQSLPDVPTKPYQVLMWILKMSPVTPSSFWCLFSLHKPLIHTTVELNCINFLWKTWLIRRQYTRRQQTFTLLGIGERKHNFLILKEHWGLNEEHLDQKPWGENKNCRVRDSGDCRCGSPFSFPSVNRLAIPRICVSSVVLFTHWFLARVKWLHTTFRKMQTSPHSVSSKAELVLPFIFVRPAGTARLSHPFLSQWSQRFYPSFFQLDLGTLTPEIVTFH